MYYTGKSQQLCVFSGLRQKPYNSSKLFCHTEKLDSQKGKLTWQLKMWVANQQLQVCGDPTSVLN